MSELLVLSNPRRRRRKAKKARRSRRSHRKMSALQMKYFGGGRRASRRRARRRVSVMSNPAPRRRARRSKSRRSQGGFARIPVVGKLLRSGTGSLGKPMSMVGPALTGAVGAVAVHAISARLPLPAQLTSGKVRFLTQGALAIGFGMIASKIPGVGSSVAAKMAEGALTVTLAEAIKEFAGDAGVNLGGMGYYLPGVRAASPSAGGNAARMGNVGKYLTGPGSNVTRLAGMRGGSRFGNIKSFGF